MICYKLVVTDTYPIIGYFSYPIAIEYLAGATDIKMVIYLVDSNKSIISALDDDPLKWLVVRHRVVFDANYCRMWRLERFLIRNPENP